MAWIRIDDHAPSHPKQLQAGPMACWLWVCGLAYCAKHLTDGEIPTAALVTFNIHRPEREAARLVAVGLWEATETGYRVHDYGEYQPSKAQVHARRERAAHRVAAWKARQGPPEEQRNGNAVTNAVANGVANAVTNALVTLPPSHPIVRTPPTPLRGAATPRPRQLRKRAEEIRTRAWGRCQHDPPCSSYDQCITRIVEQLQAPRAAPLEEAV